MNRSRRQRTREKTKHQATASNIQDQEEGDIVPSISHRHLMEALGPYWAWRPLQTVPTLTKE